MKAEEGVDDATEHPMPAVYPFVGGAKGKGEGVEGLESKKILHG